MGIQGLLPFLKEATQPVNMRKYSGYTVAVDTYCWLHKGAFACSLQLAKGEQTDMWVSLTNSIILIYIQEQKLCFGHIAARLDLSNTVARWLDNAYVYIVYENVYDQD